MVIGKYSNQNLFSDTNTIHEAEIVVAVDQLNPPECRWD